MTVTHSKRKISEPSIAAASNSNTISSNSNNQEVGIRYSCDSCYIDITNIPRIQCAICTEEVDLCIQCFSEGVSFNDHLPTHSYRILKPLDFPIFPSHPSHHTSLDNTIDGHDDGTITSHDLITTTTTVNNNNNNNNSNSSGSIKKNSLWRADEELLLLESLEQYGMGNWDEIGESISSKTSEQCYYHYLETWLPGHQPSMNWLQRQECTAQSLPANHEIAGYMPNREEFETEWENESELLLKDLSFTDNDSPVDIRLKLSILQIYNECLDRRDARIHFSISHGMINFKKHQNTDKMRGKEEREIYNNLKPFARFIPGSEFQRLLEGLVREEELRKRISQLQEWRRSGLRDPSQVSAMEGDRKHLELYLKGGGTIFSRTNVNSSFSFSPSPSSHYHSHNQQHGHGNNFMMPIKKPITSPIGLKNANVNAIMSGNNNSNIPSSTNLMTTNVNIGSIINTSNGGGVMSGIGSNTGNNGGGSSGGFALNSHYFYHHHHHHQGFSMNGNGGGGGSLGPSMMMNLNLNNSGSPATAPRKASTPLNISHADGVDLLSERERHLCSILRLYPRLYLSIKETLIRENMRMGGLKRAQARAAVKIDVNKTSKLYDFFIAAGWIRAPPSGE